MLARADRLVRAADYRVVVRRGRRSSTANAVVYRLPREEHEIVRFGFIVSKAVGNAVVRNRVRRRLKAVCFSLQTTDVYPQPGTDIVIRALPAAAEASWAELRDDVTRSIAKGVMQR